MHRQCTGSAQAMHRPCLRGASAVHRYYTGSAWAVHGQCVCSAKGPCSRCRRPDPSSCRCRVPSAAQEKVRDLESERDGLIQQQCTHRDTVEQLMTEVLGLRQHIEFLSSLNGVAAGVAPHSPAAPESGLSAVLRRRLQEEQHNLRQQLVAMRRRLAQKRKQLDTLLHEHGRQEAGPGQGSADAGAQRSVQKTEGHEQSVGTAPPGSGAAVDPVAPTGPSRGTPQHSSPGPGGPPAGQHPQPHPQPQSRPRPCPRPRSSPNPHPHPQPQPQPQPRPQLPPQPQSTPDGLPPPHPHPHPHPHAQLQAPAPSDPQAPSQSLPQAQLPSPVTPQAPPLIVTVTEPPTQGNAQAQRHPQLPSQPQAAPPNQPPPSTQPTPPPQFPPQTQPPQRTQPRTQPPPPQAPAQRNVPPRSQPPHAAAASRASVRDAPPPGPLPPPPPAAPSPLPPGITPTDGTDGPRAAEPRRYQGAPSQPPPPPPDALTPQSPPPPPPPSHQVRGETLSPAPCASPSAPEPTPEAPPVDRVLVYGSALARDGRPTAASAPAAPESSVAPAAPQRTAAPPAPAGASRCRPDAAGAQPGPAPAPCAVPEAPPGPSVSAARKGPVTPGSARALEPTPDSATGGSPAPPARSPRHGGYPKQQPPPRGARDPASPGPALDLVAPGSLDGTAESAPISLSSHEREFLWSRVQHHVQQLHLSVAALSPAKSQAGSSDAADLAALEGFGTPLRPSPALGSPCARATTPSTPGTASEAAEQEQEALRDRAQLELDRELERQVLRVAAARSPTGSPALPGPAAPAAPTLTGHDPPAPGPMATLTVPLGYEAHMRQLQQWHWQLQECQAAPMSSGPRGAPGRGVSSPPQPAASGGASERQHSAPSSSRASFGPLPSTITPRDTASGRSSPLSDGWAVSLEAHTHIVLRESPLQVRPPPPPPPLRTPRTPRLLGEQHHLRTLSRTSTNG